MLLEGSGKIPARSASSRLPRRNRKRKGKMSKDAVVRALARPHRRRAEARTTNRYLSQYPSMAYERQHDLNEDEEDDDGLQKLTAERARLIGGDLVNPLGHLELAL